MDLSISIRREEGPEESVGTVTDILDNFRGESLSGCLASLPSHTLSCLRSRLHLQLPPTTTAPRRKCRRDCCDVQYLKRLAIHRQSFAMRSQPRLL